jgi:hypothetical protein
LDAAEEGAVARVDLDAAGGGVEVDDAAGLDDDTLEEVRRGAAETNAGARLDGERAPCAQSEARAIRREHLAGLHVDVALVGIRVADNPRLATARRERLLERLALHHGVREKCDGAGAHGVAVHPAPIAELDVRLAEEMVNVRLDAEPRRDVGVSRK